MSNEDYIFREKIRHPSDVNQWIITRDYGPIDKIDDIATPTVHTVSPATLTITPMSYNYVATSGNKWVNNQDFIDKNSVTENVWPPQTNWELIGDNLTITGTTSLETVPTATIYDFTTSYVYNTSYNGSTFATPASVIVHDTTTPSWNNNFITASIGTTLTDAQIKTNDTLIIPRVNNDNTFILEAYQVIDQNVGETTGTQTINFQYNINNNDVNNILNLVDTSNNNTVTLSDMWSSCSEIIKMEFNDDKTLASLYDDNNTEISIEGNNQIYGNGTILNRLEKDNALQQIVSHFDYHWLAVQDINQNLYILKLAYDSGYKIEKLINVGITQNTSNSTIQLNALTDYSNNLPVLTFIVGWDNTIYPGNIQEFSLYKICGSYVIDTISITKSYNSNTILDSKIKELYKTVVPTNAEVVYDNFANDINLYLNTKKIQTISYQRNNTSNTITLTVPNTNNTVTASMIISVSNDEITFEIEPTNTFLLLWWDYIIEQINTVPYDNIEIQFLFSNIAGHIVWTDTINQVYALTRQHWSNENTVNKYTINNIWDKIIVTDAVTTSELDTQNWIIIYKNKLSYPTASTSIDISLSGKIWFLLEDTLVIQGENTNDYFIKIENLKTNNKFVDLIKNIYPKITIIVNIPQNGAEESDPQYRNINYQLYQYANGIRYCDAQGNLLNIGNEWTPIYLKNGQFVACNNLKDVLVDTNNETAATLGREIWIDPDD